MFPSGSDSVWFASTSLSGEFQRIPPHPFFLGINTITGWKNHQLDTIVMYPTRNNMFVVQVFLFLV
jgi:hypothetical protein